MNLGKNLKNILNDDLRELHYKLRHNLNFPLWAKDGNVLMHNLESNLGWSLRINLDHNLSRK